MTSVRPINFIAFIAALLVSAIPALASPEAVARRCIGEIRSVARAAVNEIDDATERGIAGLIRSDRAGATDDELAAAAGRMNSRIDAIAERNSRRISQLAARCVARLTEAGADQAIIDQVNDAAATASSNLSGKAERAKGRVDAALARLIG